MKAVFPTLKDHELNKKSVGEVFEAFTKFPVRLKLTESFKVEVGKDEEGDVCYLPGSNVFKWWSSKDADLIADWRKGGYECKNFVNKIAKEV